MSREMKPIEPQIAAGAEADKVVKVGPMKADGVRKLWDAVAKANLPIPDMSGELIADTIAAINDMAKESASPVAIQQMQVKAIMLVMNLIAANLPTVWKWLLGHQALMLILVTESSNLEAAEALELTAGEFMRVARAGWDALVADGYFAETASFFVGLAGVKLGKPVSDVSPATAA